MYSSSFSRCVFNLVLCLFLFCFLPTLYPSFESESILLDDYFPMAVKKKFPGWILCAFTSKFINFSWFSINLIIVSHLVYHWNMRQTFSQHLANCAVSILNCAPIILAYRKWNRLVLYQEYDPLFDEMVIAPINSPILASLRLVNMIFSSDPILRFIHS